MVCGVEVLLLVGVAMITLWLMVAKPKNYPPGPIKWPFVGNKGMLSYGGQAYKAMARVQELYGDVAGLYASSSSVVVISGLGAIREACCRNDLSGRPFDASHNIADGERICGILHTSGEVWKEQRRFTLQHLRDLGFGKRSLESIAHEEIQEVFQDIEDLSGGQKEGFPHPVDFHDLLGGTSTNVLWNIVAGKRYEHNDPKFKRLISAEQKHLQSGSKPRNGPSSYLAKIFFRIFVSERQKPHRASLADFLKEELESHKTTVDYDHPRDFIDMYLSEIERNKSDPNTSFTEKQLMQICAEMFVAGTDTTLNTLSFGILYMVLYQEAQKKLQRELDDVVGRDRLPSLDDRPKLPYVDATINEILRMSSIASTSVHHSPLTTEDGVNFRAYRIPKASRIMLNLYGLHHDPKLWKSPDEFIPERFSRKNGEEIKREALMPFGSGKRVCLGESLARNNIFLFFTAIMQRYSLRVPDGQPTPTKKPQGKIVLFPKPFTVKVNLRN